MHLPYSVCHSNPYSVCHSNATRQQVRCSVHFRKILITWSPLTESNRRPSPYRRWLFDSVTAGRTPDQAEREHRLASAGPRSSLRRDLQKITKAGLIRTSGRIYLRSYARQRKGAAGGMDQWTAERWVNDVHIKSPLPASDPAWRADVLTQALLFATGIVPGFAALAHRLNRSLSPCS